MTGKRVLLGAVALTLAAPAMAVGLGPLGRSGLTDGPAKAFWLNLSNPYREPREFRAYAIEPNSDTAVTGVEIRPATVRLGGGRQRRLLVILDTLAPGETRTVRVCAELAQAEGTIHARVCSKLSARRLPARS